MLYLKKQIKCYEKVQYYFSSSGNPAIFIMQ